MYLLYANKSSWAKYKAIKTDNNNNGSNNIILYKGIKRYFTKHLS